jgi:CarD family transcriptional regulator
VQFSIGDKIVHPHRGPGRIVDVECKTLTDEEKRYYVIEIAIPEMTVHVPVRGVEELGLRPAVSQARLPRVLDRLRSQPRRLPKDYKQRQEEVWERLRTGRVMQVAEVVRDLTWHKKRDHLTQKDAEFLTEGTQRLAAEMALVSGAEVSDMGNTIRDTLAAAMSSTVERERRHQPFTQVIGHPSRPQRKP